MALWLRFPLVPVTTSGYVPVCAGLFTLMVRSEFPDPVIEAGLNAEVVFCGSPVTLSATVPEKPFKGETETV